MLSHVIFDWFSVITFRRGEWGGEGCIHDLDVIVNEKVCYDSSMADRLDPDRNKRKSKQEKKKKSCQPKTP